MKELYYDCPLQTQWMSKMFGVRFIDPILKHELECEELQDVGSMMMSRVQVHPESLKIFEPVQGDTDGDGFTFVEETKEFVNAGCQIRVRTEVVLRKRIHFFSPLVEHKTRGLINFQMTFEE